MSAVTPSSSNQHAARPRRVAEAWCLRIDADGTLALCVALALAFAMGMGGTAPASTHSPDSCAQLAQHFRAHPIPWPMPKIIARAAGCS
jgi:hypothetical protein